MTGHIIPPPPEAHKCDSPPRAENYAPGTRWKCDDCGEELIVVTGSQYNEPYSAWRDPKHPIWPGEYAGPKPSDSRPGGES